VETEERHDRAAVAAGSLFQLKSDPSDFSYF
jgi:hypothetical protein